MLVERGMVYVVVNKWNVIRCAGSSSDDLVMKHGDTKFEVSL